MRRLLIESLLIRILKNAYKGVAKSYRVEEVHGQDYSPAIMPSDQHAQDRITPDPKRADRERVVRVERTLWQVRERARRKQRSLLSLRLMRVMHEARKVCPDPRETAIKWLTVKNPRTAKMVKASKYPVSSSSTTTNGGSS